jgi:hypothetical protein
MIAEKQFYTFKGGGHTKNKGGGHTKNPNPENPRP